MSAEIKFFSNEEVEITQGNDTVYLTPDDIKKAYDFVCKKYYNREDVINEIECRIYENELFDEALDNEKFIEDILTDYNKYREEAEDKGLSWEECLNMAIEDKVDKYFEEYYEFPYTKEYIKDLLKRDYVDYNELPKEALEDETFINDIIDAYMANITEYDSEEECLEETIEDRVENCQDKYSWYKEDAERE